MCSQAFLMLEKLITINPYRCACSLPASISPKHVPVGYGLSKYPPSSAVLRKEKAVKVPYV